MPRAIGATLGRSTGLAFAAVVRQKAAAPAGVNRWAVWTLLAGIALLFPSVAAVVFAYPVKDMAVASGWGSALIVLAVFAWTIAGDIDRFGRMAWIFVGGLLLSAVDMLYFWLTGAYTARTALPPVVINLVVAGWIWTTRPKK